MSPSLRFLLVLAGLVVVVAGGFHLSHSRFQPAQAAVDLSRSKPTVKGVYLVTIEPEMSAVPQGELHAWVLTLKAADGSPVDAATIAIDGGMPEHHHGLPTSPQVTESLGQGRYRVDGVRFNMTGRWELRFSIDAPPGRDEVAFNVVL